MKRRLFSRFLLFLFVLGNMQSLSAVPAFVDPAWAALRKEYNLVTRGSKALGRFLLGHTLSEQEKKDLKSLGIQVGALSAAAAAAVGSALLWRRQKLSQEARRLQQEQAQAVPEITVSEERVEATGSPSATASEQDVEEPREAQAALGESRADEPPLDLSVVIPLEAEQYGNDVESYSRMMAELQEQNLLPEDVSGGYYILKSSLTTPALPRVRWWAVKDDIDTLKAAVKVYKIHLMPNVADVPTILSKLSENEYFGATGAKILKNFNDVLQNNNAVIVLYAYDGKDQAQDILNQVCANFGRMQGLGITPRFNQKVTDLIYFAQGNGDEKKDTGTLSKDRAYFEQPDMIYLSEKANDLGENRSYRLDFSGCAQ